MVVEQRSFSGANSVHPDRERWNARYTARGFSGPAHPEAFLDRHRDLLSGGTALDIACGRGAVARRLTECGYRVVGVDISEVGLAHGQAAIRGAPHPVHLVLADLDHFVVCRAAFDCITVFFYHNAALAPALVDGLRPGGLLLAETYNVHRLRLNPEFNPRYLLQPGELRRLFHGLTIVEAADEIPGHPEISYLIGRKPA